MRSSWLTVFRSSTSLDNLLSAYPARYWEKAEVCMHKCRSISPSSSVRFPFRYFDVVFRCTHTEDPRLSDGLILLESCNAFFITFSLCWSLLCLVLIDTIQFSFEQRLRPCPHTWVAFLIINITHQNGIFFLIIYIDTS